MSEDHIKSRIEKLLEDWDRIGRYERGVRLKSVFSDLMREQPHTAQVIPIRRPRPAHATDDGKPCDV